MKIPVFYVPAMALTRPMESLSPRKPSEVVAQWCIAYPVEIMGFEPLGVEDFCLAHDRSHVHGILDLSVANGMDTKDKDLADTLPWTTGSFYAAASHALDHGVASSPTSGFHHAGHAFSWGFCTFNGLLIAAIKLLGEQRVKSVGILDFDQHEGDGSQDIIDKLGLGSKVVHRTGKLHYPRQREAFFEALPSLLDAMRGVDIVFYQAGADQHVDDPLGGFLDSSDLRRRDRAVFEFAKDHCIPIVWNLAGGYQKALVDGVRSIQKILDIHGATMEECLRAYWR